MAVHTAQHQAFAVEENDAILDLHLAEAYTAAFEIHCHALWIPQGQHQAIKIGRFSSPFVRVHDRLRNDRPPHFDSCLVEHSIIEMRGKWSGEHWLPIGVIQHRFNRPSR